MNEEIEEAVHHLEKTNSQNSVATSNLYSLDFTDGSSDKYNSTGMETYVLEWDSENSESPRKTNESSLQSNAILIENRPTSVSRDVQYQRIKETRSQSSTTRSRSHSLLKGQEMFTQTSKTIIELARCEGALNPVALNSLDTQTSFISIRENRTIEYRIEVSDGNKVSNIEVICNSVAKNEVNDRILTKTKDANRSISTGNSVIITELANKESINNPESGDTGDICSFEVFNNEENQSCSNMIITNNELYSDCEDRKNESNSSEDTPDECLDTKELLLDKALSDSEVLKKDSFIVTSKGVHNIKELHTCCDNYQNVKCNDLGPLEAGSSKEHISASEKSDNTVSSTSSEKSYNNIVSVVSKESLKCTEQTECVDDSDSDEYVYSSDMDEDSLMETTKDSCIKQENSDDICDTPKSVDRDIAELYSKLSESMEIQTNKPFEEENKHTGQLTPLSEESVPRKPSSANLSPVKPASLPDEDKDLIFTNKAGTRIKLLPNDKSHEDTFRLPRIQGDPSNCNMNASFPVNTNKLHLKSGNLPCVVEERRDERVSDRWDTGGRELASGESPYINLKNGSDKGVANTLQLPPIHLEAAYVTSIITKPARIKSPTRVLSPTRGPSLADLQNPINIKDKIKELKMSHKSKHGLLKNSAQQSESRSGSPHSWLEENRADCADRGCDVLCAELLKRLRVGEWYEAMDTLDDIPQMLEKFWSVISENRITDLLRQVSVHIESPRTRVARAACTTLAAILKNTGYTKKPDFFEAVTTLLTKTSSFSRPVRRAANMALDDVVCSVDLSHAVTALCVHGVAHKSPLVRCAAARLLVVCCALAGGGQDLLRARPPTAATARKHALRSLAVLLEDKNVDTRKYAERLYSMLRPLSHFVAYYLTDVDVELATRQMKKYDHILRLSSESR